MPQPYNPSAWDRYAHVNNNPINRVDPTGHAEIDPGDLSSWWKGVTPVYMMDNMQGDVIRQDKMFVAYMFQHPNYIPDTDQEIIGAGYDPGPTSALLSIQKFKAEAMRA